MAARCIVAARCNGWMKVANDFATLHEAKELATALVSLSKTNCVPPENCDLSVSDIAYMTEVAIYSLSHIVEVQTSVSFVPVQPE